MSNTSAPYVADPEIEQRDTDRDELNPQVLAAREFAGLVGNMLEPITSRLDRGDGEFRELRQQVSDIKRMLDALFEELTSQRAAMNAMNERLTRLEGQHCSRHPRDSMPQPE